MERFTILGLIASAAFAPLLTASSMEQSGIQKACPAEFMDRRGLLDHDNRVLQTMAVVTNGVITLGIHDEGHLNVEGPPSATGTSVVGLRFSHDGEDWEATAHGCTCEGFGVSAKGEDTGVTVFGYANDAAGISGLTAEPIVTDGVSATTVAKVGPDSKLKITHRYEPAPQTKNLYQVTVTLENTGTEPLTELRYRRAMDWDVPPTTFSECVTIDTGSSSDIEYVSDDGFDNTDPTSPISQILFTCPGGGEPCPVFDNGPADHGAVFQFLLKDDGVLRTLDVGESFSFNIYYGGANNKVEANSALALVGAEVYSFGYPNNGGTCSASVDGSPNTFIFAFGGVGGIPLFATCVNTTVNVDETCTATITADDVYSGPIATLSLSQTTFMGPEGTFEVTVEAEFPDESIDVCTAQVIVSDPLGHCTAACPNELRNFILVDADTNSDVGPLGDYKVEDVPLKLNVRAEPVPCEGVPSTDSVLVEFDNPRISFCEIYTPFTVFGDPSKKDVANEDADYKGVEIPVGTHTVTATPYTSADCSTGAGIPLSLNFKVETVPMCVNEVTGFTLIDPDTDTAIGPLGDYDSSTYPSGVNIRADFSPCSTPDYIDSVRVTFDKPSVSFCEVETPYSVFRDSPKGDYRTNVIPVGVHTVSATPYLSADCTSDPGPTFSQTFEVTAIAGYCVTGFKLYDSITDVVVPDSILIGGEISDGSTVPAGRPCKLNIEAVADGCLGFDISTVRLQLRDAMTDAGIKGRRENDAPYMLYGDKDGDILNGSLAPGSYRIRAAALLDGESRYQDYYEIEFELDACAGDIRLLRGKEFAK